MDNYVLAFRGPADRAAAPGEDEAWSAWFGSLGGAVVDFGHRVGHVRALPAEGGKPASSVLTGYLVIAANDLEAAITTAQGCPGLSCGVSVEVGEIVVA